MSSLSKRWTSRVGAIALATLLLGSGLGAVHAPLADAASHASAHTKIAARTKGLYPMTVKDDLGRTVVIKEKPVHIVSLTLGTDEVLTALLPPSDIAGIDYFSTDPTYSHIAGLVRKDHLKIMGSATGSINAEQIIAAHPDLVLVADYTNQNVVRQLMHVGIPVYEFTTFNSFANIESHIITLGKIVDQPSKAEALVAHIQARLAALKASQPKKKLTVLYYTWGDVAGANTTGNDVILAAGGINAAAKMNGWATVSAEEVVKLNPDVVVIPDDSGAKDAELKSFLSNPAFKNLKAVKAHHVYTAPDANLSDVAQYFPMGVQDVQQMLDRALGLK
ncbi:MAG: ABC transporter substrate-binding protein [Firmicutes bacterium]|nr:ABC transporter substrate-binding protein [Bacillota bacterium]